MSVGQSRQQYRGCQTPAPISPLGNNNPAFAWHDNGREILFNNQPGGEFRAKDDTPMEYEMSYLAMCLYPSDHHKFVKSLHIISLANSSITTKP
eukprot:scaffold59067_cov75-Cyclotella_meneghiniana.AAC.1